MIPEATDGAVRKRLSVLFDRVAYTNAQINITSLVSEMDVTLKHIIDSLTLFFHPDFQKAIQSGKSVCDIGCGGGFPGLPIGCVVPQANITMIDSTEKKIHALQENASVLGLTGINPVWGRGEELASAKGGKHRERYDVCVSRAVARLPVLCELCLPFVKPGGVFFAMKGMRAQEELEESMRAIRMLGGKLKEVYEIHFDPEKVDRSDFSSEELALIEEFFSASRSLIVIEKKKTTQPIYPRKWAQMTKKSF